MVWYLALCPDDTEQESVVYGAEFVVVFLAKGPRSASIQKGVALQKRDCYNTNQSNHEVRRK